MQIAMTGATGFVGSHLEQALKRDGHQVVRLGREDFDPPGTKHLGRRLEGCQAVLNLAGEPINRRWTEAYKQRMVSSRVVTTQRLVAAMSQLGSPPGIFISTSAMGAFASENCYTESDIPDGTDFLGCLARDWEQAASGARAQGIRTLIFRFGLVLGNDGGLLKQLLIPFRFGLGGPVGDGNQHFSWVHIDDLVEAYRMALENDSMEGAYHVCAPNPVSNREFSETLGAVLKRPAVFRVPLFMLKLLYGEGGDAMASGQCVTSARLPELGFQFRYPALGTALENLVGGNSQGR